MRKHSIFVLTFIAIVLTAAPAPARTTVQVDRFFGTDGTVEARLGPTYSRTFFTSVAPQPDGTILAARGSGSESTQWVRRYSADGTLDTGFPPVEASRRPQATDGDGRVLRAEGWALQRFHPDGSPDLTFGTRPWGEGRISDEAGFRIEQIAPLPSGKVLVGGSIVVHIPESVDYPGHTYVEQVALARFDEEGRLDDGFGNGGIVKLKSDAGVGGERLLGLAARPGDGVAAIVLDSLAHNMGESVSHSGSTIVGLGADGRLDSSFGAAGSVRLADAAILAFRSLPGGELLVAGDRWGPALAPRAAHTSDVFLNRYTPAGQPDPSFGGGDGSVIIDLAGIDLVGAMLVAEDGSVYLGGSASVMTSANCKRFYSYCRETPFVLRFTPQGVLTPEFGSGGVLTLDVLSWPYGPFEGGIGVKALAFRPGGILAAGGSGTAAFLAALSSTGALDPGFGSAGIVRESESRPSSSEANASAVDSRGRILVIGKTNAGIAGHGPTGALFRYLSDGRLDQSFGGDGYVRVPGEVSGVAVAADDSTYALSRSGATVTKLTASGRVDLSFGEEGTVVLPSRVGEVHRRGRRYRLWADPVSMTVLRDGRLLIAGTAQSGESRVFALRLRRDGSLDPGFGKQGIAVHGFGRSLRCVANQIAVQRDGRIVFAGFVRGKPSEERSETLAVMRLRADGARDRGFGRRGLAVARIGHRSFASAVAIQGDGRILVAGKTRTRDRVRELLLRYRADGRLDRSFGHGGVVSRPVPLLPGGFFASARQILLQPTRILVLRDNHGEQLLVYSRNGLRRRLFEVTRSPEEAGRSNRAPFGALQGDRLVLGWTVYGTHNNHYNLQRLLIGG